jgi:hypothetical protein
MFWNEKHFKKQPLPHSQTHNADNLPSERRMTDKRREVEAISRIFIQTSKRI